MIQDSEVENIYNFDLDQWEFERMTDESLSSYISRISESRIKNSKNFAAWDLSVYGSMQFNNLYKTDPDVYYFSYHSIILCVCYIY